MNSNSLAPPGSVSKKSWGDFYSNDKKTQKTLHKNISSLEQKSKDFRLLNSQNGVFPEIHLRVENCKDYPYYGVDSNGPQNFREDFMKLIEQSKQCFFKKNKGRNLPVFVENKVTELYQLLLTSKDKTVACTFGEYNSFYAVSNSGLNQNDYGPNGVFLDMPKPPSIFMDTNRMAGNFPLGMDSEDIRNFRQFYGQRLNNVEIQSGKRNPLAGRVENSASLLFHEMLHWVGLSHSQKGYPDLVYLSQICCFNHPSIDVKKQQKACKIFYNDNYWSGSKEQRKRKMDEDSIPAQQKILIQHYHQLL